MALRQRRSAALYSAALITKYSGGRTIRCARRAVFLYIKIKGRG